MNKIKVMYDVVKKMREKNVFQGTLNVEGKKDNEKVARIAKEFFTNNITGETKVKINVDVNLDGAKIQHNGDMEFNKKDCHHHHHTHHGNHMHHCHGKCMGIKGKLSKVAFILNVLDNINADEDKDESVVLSLNLKEVCGEMKEIKEMLKEKASSHSMPHGDKHAKIKEFLDMEYDNLELKILINRENEVEKITIVGDGKKKNELNEVHEKSFNAELNLNW